MIDLPRDHPHYPRDVENLLNRIAANCSKARLEWDGNEWTFRYGFVPGEWCVETWGPTTRLAGFLDVICTDAEIDAVLACPECNSYLLAPDGRSWDEYPEEVSHA